MPAYNFQAQFVPMILAGTKRHTIRRRRKQPTRVGDILWLFTGLRTKECRLLVGANCTRIEPITIWPFEQRIIANIDFSVNQLAFGDGFGNLAEFFNFFKKTYRKEVLEDFEIIFWDTTQMISSKDFIQYLGKAVPNGSE